MIRSKFSTKAILLATGIGLSAAAFAGSQPAAAQSYTCPDGLAYDPAVGCTLGGDDYGYYGYPAILRGHPDHHDFGHGFGHGVGGLGHMDGRGVGLAHVAHFGGAGFAHGMGVAHAGGFGGHAMGGGFGGGGHR
jgi:hypothetical protein